MTVTNPYYQAADLCEQGWVRGREVAPSEDHTYYCAMGAIRTSVIEQLKVGLDIPGAFSRQNNLQYRLIIAPDLTDKIVADSYIYYGDSWMREHSNEFHGSRAMFAYNDSTFSSRKKIAHMLRRIGYSWEQEYGDAARRPPLTRTQKAWAWLDKAFSGLPKTQVMLPIIEPPVLRDERLLAEAMRLLRDEQYTQYTIRVEFSPQVLDLSFTEKVLVSS